VPALYPIVDGIVVLFLVSSSLTKETKLVKMYTFLRPLILVMSLHHKT